MAAITTTLPSITFPWELDIIEIQLGSSETTAAVTLSLDNTQFFSATLYPESDGVVRLRDLGTLLSDKAAAVGMPATFDITAGSDSASATLLPCRFPMDVTAEEFVSARFLSVVQSRMTYPSATELLSVYENGADAPTVTLTCLWADPEDGTTETTTETAQEAESTFPIWQFGFRIADLTAPSEGLELVRVTATCGARNMVFTLRSDSSEDATPTSVGFINAFSCEETYHFFGTAEKEVKAEHEQASFVSRGLANYRTIVTPQWKFHTGFLTDKGLALTQDLCATPNLWRMADGVMLCVTDEEIKTEDGGRYDANKATVTVREASDYPMIRTAVGIHVFDETFDDTFN